MIFLTQSVSMNFWNCWRASLKVTKSLKSSSPCPTSFEGEIEKRLLSRPVVVWNLSWLLSSSYLEFECYLEFENPFRRSATLCISSCRVQKVSIFSLKPTSPPWKEEKGEERLFWASASARNVLEFVSFDFESVIWKQRWSTSFEKNERATKRHSSMQESRRWTPCGQSGTKTSEIDGSLLRFSFRMEKAF